jgi:hypothetical protein
LPACETRVETAGLRALYPEPDTEYVAVESIQPLLRWEAFPTADMIDTIGKEAVSAFSDVTYEVRIWRAEDDYPSSLAYERSGLTATRRRVGDGLGPSGEYQWSVRAHFELNGQRRVSPWGMLAKLCQVRSSQVPSRCYYRFSTPAPP